MKRSSDTKEQRAHRTSSALMEMGNREFMTSTPQLSAPKFKKPNERASTSDSEENQPEVRRRKPKKNKQKNEDRVVQAATSKKTIQPPSIEYATSQTTMGPPKSKQTSDFETFKKESKTFHDKVHAAESERGQNSANEDVARPMETSFGTSFPSTENSSDSERSETGKHSDGTHASNQEPNSQPVRIDHDNMQTQTNQPEAVEDSRYRVISVEDWSAEDVEEQAIQTEAPTEVESQRKRTISVEDCEIDEEMTESMTRMNRSAQRQQEIETVDLSIDVEEEVAVDENNIVHENVPAKSLRSAAADSAGKEPQQIDEKERSFVPITKKPSISLRRHRYKKTPRRMTTVNEIKLLQGSVDLLIPKVPFQRLVREILHNQRSGDLHIQGKALAALHEAAEKHMIELFEETVLLCTHRDRVTIALKDIRLAGMLQEHFELNHRTG